MLRPLLRPLLRPPMSAALGILLGVGFSPAQLFSSGEPGAHFEAYNPDDLLARRNLLTYSEDLTNAAWQKLQCSASVAGDRYKIVESVVADAHILLQDVPAMEADGFTFYADLEAGERDLIQVTCYGLAGGECNFNLTTGQVTFMSTNVTRASITAIGGGVYRCEVHWAAVGSPIGVAMYPIVGGVASYAGDGVSGYYIHRAQMQRGNAALAYQKVTDWNTEYIAAARDRISMWQDASGTTPVTAVEQPVGLWFDQSQGVERGAEMFSLDFTTAAIIGGVTATTTNTFTTDATGGGPAYVGLLTVGRVYEFRIEGSTTAPSLYLRNTNGLLGSVSVSSGSFSIDARVMWSENSTFWIQNTGAGTTTVNSISVKLVAGHHAAQHTGVSRPTLSARYNEFTNTELFNDPAMWSTQDGASITANTVDGPARRAATLTFTTGALGALKTTSSFGPGTYVMSIYVRVASGTQRFRMTSYSATDGQADSDWMTATTEWQQFTWTRTVTAASGFYPVLNGEAVAKEFYVWGADLRSADDADKDIPTYQRVNTATDYDSAGFPHYLKFDGTDDSLQTGSINFSGTDKMTLWAGVTKLSDAATALLAEFTVSGSAADGGFHIATSQSSLANYQVVTRGTVQGAVGLTPNSFAAPVTNVLAAQMDNGAGTSATQLIARVNGVQQVLSFTFGPTTAGNFANDVLHIGRRNNTSFPFNGRLSMLTARGAATTAAQISSMERYVARRSGITL
jgi:fluoride ion exporter CrcB/FEX